MLYAFKLGRKLRGEEPYCPEKGGKGGSSDKSAKYASEAQKYAADLQNQQWQTIMKNLAPFTPLAEQYVNQLQNLSSLEGQGRHLISITTLSSIKTLQVRLVTRVLLLRRLREDLVRQPQAINWLRSRRLSVSLGYQTR